MPAATPRIGFTDAYHASRLQHVNGVTYPTTPAGTFLSIYAGNVPLSDGTGGNEATGTRPAIVLGTPLKDVNGRYYMTNASAITGIALGNASAEQLVGFGICGTATGGVPIYIGPLPAPYQVQPNATITIPAGSIRVYAEGANF